MALSLLLSLDCKKKKLKEMVAWFPAVYPHYQSKGREILAVQ